MGTALLAVVAARRRRRGCSVARGASTQGQLETPVKGAGELQDAYLEQSADFVAEGTSLEQSVDLVAERLRNIDGLRCRVHRSGGLDLSMDALHALKELEELAGLPDTGSLAAALARAMSPEDPGDPTVQEAAQRAAGSLVAGDLGASAVPWLETSSLLEATAAAEAPVLSEAEERLAARLVRYADAAGRSTSCGGSWPPPPPKYDTTNAAQAARLPAITALADACRDSRAGQGMSELRAFAKRRRPMPLSSLLTELGEELLVSAGDSDADVTGIIDDLALVRHGDVAVLPWPARGYSQAAAELAEVASSGAAAIVFFGLDSSQRGEAQRVADLLPEFSGLQCMVSLTAHDVASRMASAFFRNPGARLRLAMVLGDDATEVRTTSWLLTCVLEGQLGAAKIAALNGRRTLVGRDAVDVGRALTPCIVQELLEEMAEAGVGLCVVEALPGAQLDEAFSGLRFEWALDLGTGSESGAVPLLPGLRSRLLAQTKPGGILAAQHTTQAREALPGFGLVAPPAQPLNSVLDAIRRSSRWSLKERRKYDDRQVELNYDSGLPFRWLYGTESQRLRKTVAGLSRPEVSRELKALDVSVPASGDDADRRERLFKARLEEETAAQKLPSEPPEGVLQGEVLPGSSIRGLRLALRSRGVDDATLSLPLVGIAGARAAVAAARAAMAMGFEGTIVKRALEAAPPPPGVLELLQAGPASRVVAVLHEANTPREVRRTLQAIQEFMAMGAEEDCQELPEITAVLGCEGEMHRGDRAKYGWALAEFCDNIVLTSNQPRGELPMQIMEDILEAVRGRVAREGTGERMPAKEVHVVTDRVDAVKLAVCRSTRRQISLNQFGLVVVFGSSHSDVQEATDTEGRVRHWLCSDRLVLMEALKMEERINGVAQRDNAISVDISQVPWQTRQTATTLGTGTGTSVSQPGQSLHWTYKVSVSTVGGIRDPL